MYMHACVHVHVHVHVHVRVHVHVHVHVHVNVCARGFECVREFRMCVPVRVSDLLAF